MHTYKQKTRKRKQGNYDHKSIWSGKSRINHLLVTYDGDDNNSYAIRSTRHNDVYTTGKSDAAGHLKRRRSVYSAPGIMDTYTYFSRDAAVRFHEQKLQKHVSEMIHKVGESDATRIGPLPLPEVCSHTLHIWCVYKEISTLPSRMWAPYRVNNEVLLSGMFCLVKLWSFQHHFDKSRDAVTALAVSGPGSADQQQSEGDVQKPNDERASSLVDHLSLSPSLSCWTLFLLSVQSTFKEPKLKSMPPKLQYCLHNHCCTLRSSVILCFGGCRVGALRAKNFTSIPKSSTSLGLLSHFLLWLSMITQKASCVIGCYSELPCVIRR